MRNPHFRFTIRWMLAVMAGAVIALAVIALVTQKLSMALRSYQEWPAAQAETAARDRAVRNRAIAIAARKYEAMYGKPPPSAMTVAPGQIAHVIARWEADRRDYLVRFGYQYVVNNERDSFGRPIPFKSGLTVLESFRVGEDGSCEHVGVVEGGQY
jgi:hypothetical protein